MKRVLLGLMVMIGVGVLRGEPERTDKGDGLGQSQAVQERYAESFERSWATFVEACLAGNVKGIEAQCGSRLVRMLEDSSLSFRLGQGWKAEGMSLKRKIILVPNRPYEAAAFVILEVTERGKAKLQVMSWVFAEGTWRCLNLPFENTLLPPAMKYPPLWCETEPD